MSCFFIFFNIGPKDELNDVLTGLGLEDFDGFVLLNLFVSFLPVFVSAKSDFFLMLSFPPKLLFCLWCVLFGRCNFSFIWGFLPLGKINFVRFLFLRIHMSVLLTIPYILCQRYLFYYIQTQKRRWLCTADGTPLKACMKEVYCNRKKKFNEQRFFLFIIFLFFFDLRFLFFLWNETHLTKRRGG